ncbi:MAG: transcriptional repressor NrdR [Candidatus Doudnabacteria bacterium]|nr:transcriptional repressor NrdR [Candidatus Doudnabacteria bacterium]
MNCPNCSTSDTKVLDSRPTEEGNAIRRRRECDKCGFRFSTYEEIEILGLSVIKRDGTKQAYIRDKLEAGIRKPFEKLEYDSAAIRKIVSSVEQEIQKKARDNCITSREIGDIVMKQIKKTDKVAYIRFACVYRAFEDVEEFKLELQKL